MLIFFQSGTFPIKFGITIPLVFLVIFFSILFISICKDSISISARTGVAPLNIIDETAVPKFKQGEIKDHNKVIAFDEIYSDANKGKFTGSSFPLAVLGTLILWFGWFGFNSGSALGANNDAIMAFATTNTASAMSMITWIILEGMKGKKIKATSACIGAVVGLVVITPAAGFVSIGQSFFIGFIGAVICNHFLSFFRRFDIDDTLDVFACHGMGGIVGLLLTGIFAKDVGLIYGETETFINHIYALLIISIFTFAGSYLLYKLTALIVPIRVSEEMEEKGLDIALHGEYIN